ncbi:MAG: S-layer homology domain-containing protein [Candidatus Altimarinota bacterium]
MQKSQRLISLSFLVTALSVLGISQVSAAFFQDTSGHWASQYAESLKTECGVEGYKDSQGNLLQQFRPNASITRAELVKMIIQCMGDGDYNYDNNINFKDVRSGDWFYQVIADARAEGWVDGYSDGTFRPNQSINRAEALKIILSSRFSPGDFSSTNSQYADVSSSDWFAKYINLADRYDFVGGYSNGTFRPSNLITRAEAAKVIILVKHWNKSIADNSDNQNNDTDNNTDTPDNNDNDSSSDSGSAPQIAGCQIFPSDNPWNTDISNYPIHPNSANYISSILSGRQNLHPDFGSNPDYGIPWVTVDGSQPLVQVNADYADESDFGMAPIPPNAPIEGGADSDGDRHVIVLDKTNCVLYEMYYSFLEGNTWSVGSAAKFMLNSNALRPAGWTSADAAGLPILPGLVRYDEVAAGEINHAVRFTVSKSQRAYIHPATHWASSSTDSNRPPMGLRLRLKQDFDLSGYTGQSRVILEALKKYGMIMADNGSDWFITGDRNPNWDDEDLSQIKQVPGSAFEVVSTGAIITE